MKNFQTLFVKGQKISVKILMILMISSLNIACSDDDDNSSEASYKNGAIIINEGAFNNSNASVSYLNYSNQEVTGNIFKAVNGSDAVLGDVLMDMTVTNNEAFLVLNSSNYISVVNSETFKWVTNIDNLNNPRFIAKHNNYLYVTQWGVSTGGVTVINPQGYEIVNTIETGLGTEGILVHDNLIWVANSGGYATDSTVSIIDPSSNTVTSTITTPNGPRHFAVDVNNNIWVVCYGAVTYDSEPPYAITNETPSYLVQISADSKKIIKELKISDTNHSSHISISPNGKTIYTDDSRGIFATPIDATVFPTEPFIKNSGDFYGFSIHPENGDIYTFIVPAWDRAGSIKVYNPEEGKLTQTINDGIGIGPSKIIF